MSDLLASDRGRLLYPICNSFRLGVPARSVEGLGFRAMEAGYICQHKGVEFGNLGLVVQCLALKVEALAERVEQPSSRSGFGGFRVYGLGFRAQGLTLNCRGWGFQVLGPKV